MKIQPTNNVSFGRSYHTRVIKNSGEAKRVIDTITLNNNNEVSITKRYQNDTLFSKLTTLKDKCGEFIKTKINYYNTKGKRNYTKTVEGLGGYLDEK